MDLVNLSARPITIQPLSGPRQPANGNAIRGAGACPRGRLGQGHSSRGLAQSCEGDSLNARYHRHGRTCEPTRSDPQGGLPDTRYCCGNYRSRRVPIRPVCRNSSLTLDWKQRHDTERSNQGRTRCSSLRLDLFNAPGRSHTHRTPPPERRWGPRRRPAPDDHARRDGLGR